jgi:proline racemase
MEIKRNILTVDSHTAGEPTRVVVGGFPPILGENMAEKRTYLSNNLDDLRKFFMREA